MIRNALFAAFLVAAPATAWAGGDHDHVGKHGGKVVESGHHHVELVAKDGEITLYVLGEDDKPEDVKAAKATATVLSGGKSSTVAFTPGDSGVFTGKGDFIAKSATVVVTLTMPDHKPEQAKFKLD